jgi:hypothetical protein
VVSTTIIDGNQSGSVVCLAGTEDETCVLSGFTLRNGSGTAYLSPLALHEIGGGGIFGGESLTRATIENSIITANSAW